MSWRRHQLAQLSRSLSDDDEIVIRTVLFWDSISNPYTLYIDYSSARHRGGGRW